MTHTNDPDWLYNIWLGLYNPPQRATEMEKDTNQQIGAVYKPPKNGELNILSDRTESLLCTNRQVGGDHYLKMKIQPVEYIVKNNIGYREGSAIKYISRWQHKGGVEDLKKAIHCLEMIILEVENESLHHEIRTD